MVRAKTDQSKRAAAVERILAGTSTVGREAKRLRVRPQAVAGFVTAWKKNKADPLDAGIPDAPAAGGPTAGDDISSGARLRRARSSAGIGEDAAGDRLPGGGDSESVESDSVPAPTPDELVALCEAFRSLGMRTYASILGADVDDPKIQSTFVFTEGERTALRLSAPYATKYVPMLIGQSDAVGAVGFAATLVLSMVQASATIREHVREKKAKTIDAQPAPFQGSPVGHNRPGRPPINLS